MTASIDLPPARPTGSPGESVVAALRAVRGLLSDVADGLVRVDSADLAEVAAEASGVVAAAEAVRAAVVLEASGRGVIADSDHPRPQAWVEQSCRDAGVPVVRRRARDLHEVAVTCEGRDVAGLRGAVTSGRLAVEVAATVAAMYRRLKTSIEYPHWDDLLEVLIDWAAGGASARELRALEDALIGRYGPEGKLDDEHARDYRARELTAFRRDRAGRLVATLRLDAASEATFTAAIHALSAPHLDENGDPDPRTPGQRRADALLTMASLATTPDKDVRGSGSKARVTVTMSLDDLRSGLGAAGVSGGPGASGAAGVPGGGAGGSSSGAGRGRGFGTTGFDQVLSPCEVRRLACDAQIIPAVLGTHGELLDLGHAKRLVTPGLTAALHLRDKGCTYPGCASPPTWCDGHHVIHWARGGPTDLGNLALLCRHHHVEVHRHDHTATIDPVTGVRWMRRDGTPIGNMPRAAT